MRFSSGALFPDYRICEPSQMIAFKILILMQEVPFVIGTTGNALTQRSGAL
jgi:hypothetical protein